jgi:hypothetical protein
VDNLVEWARCNQTGFYGMLARLMPTEIHEFIERRRLLSKEGIITEASIKVKKIQDNLLLIFTKIRN